jgi:hypothetical protein
MQPDGHPVQRVHDGAREEIPDTRSIHPVEPDVSGAGEEDARRGTELARNSRVSRLPQSVGAMHWRGSVLTREPILDAPTKVARESHVPLGAGVILARVAAASYIGTLTAWSTGILVLGAARHGTDAFVPAGSPEGIAVYLGALVGLPLVLALRSRPAPVDEGPPRLAAGGPLK